MRNFNPILLSFLFTFSIYAQQATVFVTGKIQNYEGQIEVPKEIFGVHAGNFTGLDQNTVDDWGIESIRYVQTLPTGGTGNDYNDKVRVVDCWYDRFQPATILDRPSDWESYLQGKVTDYKNALSSQGRKGYLEFWNEPYLNWAYKPGVNTDPSFYKTSGVQKGDPVYRNGSNTPEPYLIWDSTQWYDSPKWAQNRQGIYNAISGAWNYQLGQKGIPYPGLEGALEEGESYYIGSSKEFTVINTLRPVDTTQRSFYSAKQNGHYYNQMLKVVGDQISSENANIDLIAGWGFESHKDHWRPWETLLKPMIDQHYGLIDGIHEHHYSMDTRIIASDYETIFAYIKQNYGKSIKFYNTETGGFLDPQRPESVANNPGNASPGEKALNAFHYHVKDILYLIDKSPNKVAARAAHEPQNTNGGVMSAFKILKSLRGSLIYDTSNDEDIISVSSLDGNILTVAVFNNDSVSRDINIQIHSPNGLNFDSGILLQVDTNSSGNAVVDSSSISVSGSQYQTQSQFESGDLQVYKFTTTGIMNADTVQIAEYYASDILLSGNMGDISVQIDIPTAELPKFQSAKLKMGIMENMPSGISWNNISKNYAFKGGKSISNLGGISYANISLSEINAQNTLKMSTGNQDVELWFASVLLISDTVSDIITASQVIEEQNQIEIFPNPANETVNIKGTATDEVIQIYDLQGKIIMTEKSAQNNVQFNISNIPSGTYILKAGYKNFKLLIE